MGFFRKKTDPITERAKSLNAQIASLEAQIQSLATQEGRASGRNGRHLRWRTTAVPHGALAGASSMRSQELVFEDLDHNRLQQQSETGTPDHYNELGIRKYDLPAAWRRFLHQFRGPPSSNPKLVNYLAAGSIQGLRPLRYEKRIARNRFLFFLVCLILALLGVVTAFMRHY
jgi:hypothetical protein